MIVVGYSADAFGRAAIDHGIAEARLRNTDLLVINATSGSSYVDRRFASSGDIHDLEEQLRESGVGFDVRQPVVDDVVEELLTAMDRPDAELLVLGIRYRSPVGKLVLGSVSQRLILECPKPVLAVKPREY